VTSTSAEDANPSPLAAPTHASDGDLPHVCVVIPVYNGSHEVLQTLTSALSQVYPSFDVLAIDDGSRDDSSGTIERFLKDHPGAVRVLRHDGNWGLSRTLNHGLRETTGPAVLVLHQDITLAHSDWMANAVRDLDRGLRVAVATGNYGLPATREVDFAQRVFGVMRRQFHASPDHGLESVTFSEFKCDLVRRSAIDAVGGFPERFRIAGEDLWVSCALRAQGWEILKDYSLRSVQRFSGPATSISGNLRKEFTFGKAIAGTLIRFRTALARGLQRTPYSRSRSWNRASQPFVVLGLILTLILWALTGNPLILAIFGGLLVARLIYYVVRLYPGLRQIIGRSGRALAESALGAPLGVVTDFSYTVGLGAGILGWALGRKL